MAPDAGGGSTKCLHQRAQEGTKDESGREEEWPLFESRLDDRGLESSYLVCELNEI